MWHWTLSLCKKSTLYIIYKIFLEKWSNCQKFSHLSIPLLESSISLSSLLKGLTSPLVILLNRSLNNIFWNHVKNIRALWDFPIESIFDSAFKSWRMAEKPILLFNFISGLQGKGERPLPLHLSRARYYSFLKSLHFFVVMCELES